MVKRITVNGRSCKVVPYTDKGPVPGSVVGQWTGRRVYRVLCEDGADLILRSVRNGNIVVTMPKSEVVDEFGLVLEL